VFLRARLDRFARKLLIRRAGSAAQGSVDSRSGRTELGPLAKDSPDTKLLMNAPWIAIAVAVLMRIALIAALWSVRGPDAFTASDTASYLGPASALAATLSFVDASGHPEIFRTPGYPLFLAPGIRAGHTVVIALAGQLALSALLVWLTFAIARRTSHSNGVAGWAALAVAVEPTGLLWSVKLMPETLLTVLVLAFVGAVVWYLDTPSAPRAAAAAAAIAAAAYVKPIAYPLAIAAAVTPLAVLATRNTIPKRHAILFAAMCVIGVGMWQLRNATAAGYAGFSSQLDHAVYLSAGGSIASRNEGVRFEQVRVRMLQQAAKLEPVGDTTHQSRFAMMRHEGLALVASNPMAFVEIQAAGVVRTLFDPGSVEYFRAFGAYPEQGGLLARAVDRGPWTAARELAELHSAAFWTSAAFCLLTAPYVIAPWIAVVHVRPPVRRTFVVTALVAAYFVLASGGVPGSSRFRVPLVPLFVIMSACGAQPSAFRRF
jgi:Dolichyl-phosphate-mannose-protein mannosyltransferase